MDLPTTSTNTALTDESERHKPHQTVSVVTENQRVAPKGHKGVTVNKATSTGATMNKSPPSPTVKKSSPSATDGPRKNSAAVAAATAVLERANAARKKYAVVESTPVVPTAAAGIAVAKAPPATNHNDDDSTATSDLVKKRLSAVHSVISDRKLSAVKTTTKKEGIPKAKPNASAAAKAAATATSAQADALAKAKAKNAVNRGAAAAAGEQTDHATKPGAVAVQKKDKQAKKAAATATLAQADALAKARAKSGKGDVTKPGAVAVPASLTTARSSSKSSSRAPKDSTLQRLETDVLTKTRSRPGHNNQVESSQRSDGSSTAPMGNRVSLGSMSVASEASTMITSAPGRSRPKRSPPSIISDEEAKHGLRMATPDAEDDEEDDIVSTHLGAMTGIEVGSLSAPNQRGVARSWSGDVSVLTQDTSSQSAFGGVNSVMSLLSMQESVPVAAEIVLPTLAEGEENSQRVKRMVAEELERERQQQVFVNAVPEEDDSGVWSSKVLLIGSVISILFCLVVIVPLAVILPKEKNSGNNSNSNTTNSNSTFGGGGGWGNQEPTPTGTPSLAPSFSIEDMEESAKFQAIIQVILPLYSTIFGGDEAELMETTLLTRGTAQFEALNWMVYKDLFVQLDDTGLLRTPELEVQQRYALAVFYFATTGPNWHTQYDFLSPYNSVCSWGIGEEGLGTICDVDFATVQSLQFGKFFYFVWLWTANVSFAGGCHRGEDLDRTHSAPFFFYNKSGDNALAGSLPRELALLTGLNDVDFENSNFQGTTIPTEFGAMRNLDTLSLFGCQLTGKIPVEFELLVTVTLLDLQQNQLSGPLPTGLYLLSNSLAELAVRDNLLTGGIPTEYGLLTNLQVLDLGNTGISGRIPSELGLLGGMLASLYLDSNLLTGALPSELGFLDRLWYLWLHNNTAITGTVPTEWTSMVSLQQLFLEGTSVTGDLDFIACNSNLTETTAECGPNDVLICICCTKCTGGF
jgi:hypothetical protein